MDILLERILSLVPLEHGGDKEFALSIGYKSGNVISDWKAGRSFSYKNKVQEIANVYNVSSEWLYGISDKKEKSTVNDDGLDEETIQLKEIWDSADQEEREALLAMAKMLKARRNK